MPRSKSSAARWLAEDSCAMMPTQMLYSRALSRMPPAQLCAPPADTSSSAHRPSDSIPATISARTFLRSASGNAKAKCARESDASGQPLTLRRTFGLLISACNNQIALHRITHRLEPSEFRKICRDSNESDRRMIFDSLLAKGLASNLDERDN